MHYATKVIGLLGIIMTVLLAYRGLLYPIALLRRPRPRPETEQRHAFGVLISARNEAPVIAGLIRSLREQAYPTAQLRIFVVADNCTDETARVARAAGATCFERFDRVRVGKGYALDWLIARLRREGLDAGIDAWLVFDADNIVDTGFVAAMNRALANGEAVVTSFRASKNFDDNWLSAAYSAGFMHDAYLFNYPKALIGLSAAVYGTGFMVADHVLRHYGGWPFHLLSEDIEFTAALVLDGYRVSYCHEAIFYDEQPTHFAQSCRQRLRWAKGSMQVSRHYGLRLLRAAITRRSLVCLETLLMILPFALLLAGMLLGFAAMALISLFSPSLSYHDVLPPLINFVTGYYVSMVAVGLITVLSCWRRIHANPLIRLSACVTFPLYALSYAPLYLYALVADVHWKPIAHGVQKDLDAIRRGATQ